MSETSRQVPPTTAYFDLPGARRPPFWRLGLFVLLVLGAHLTGLFLAFGVVSRSTPPELLPALSVRVLELAPLPAKVELPRKPEPPQSPATPAPVAALAPPKPAKPVKQLRQSRPARAPAAAVKKAAPTPPALLTAAADAPTTSFAVAPPAPAAVAAALPAPASLVGARFDADYLRNPSPLYPAASRRLGEEGRVVLRVTVSAEGLPASIEIKQSSGFRRLDEAARAAVERWRFVPARRGAVAVESTVLIPLQFTLNG